VARIWPENEGHRPNPRNKPRSPADGSYKSPGGKSKCCSYVEAGKALRRRKFRLAVRYVRLDIKRRMAIA
jgi:hypothetical protein